MDRETKGHILWIAFLWVVFTAIGEWLVQAWIDHWPTIASAEGEITGEAIFFLLRAVTPVFLLIVLIVAYSAVRFRVPAGDDRPAEAQFTSGWLFVGTWLGLSVVLNVIFVFYPGIYGLEALWAAAAAENPLTIEVTGSQWQWDYHYADADISTTDELVVPLGRPIRFELTSADVMHSFWVPAWGMKKAVIPGETRVMVVTPTEALDTASDPVLRVQCAQICGIGHPLMRSDVRVLAAADFDAWIAGQKAGDMGAMNMGGDAGGAVPEGMMRMPDGSLMPTSAMPGAGDAGDAMPGDAMPGMDMGGDAAAPTTEGGVMPGMNDAMPDSGAMDQGTMPQSGAMEMNGSMPADQGGSGTMKMEGTMPTDTMPEDTTPEDTTPAPGSGN